MESKDTDDPFLLVDDVVDGLDLTTDDIVLDDDGVEGTGFSLDNS